MSLTFSVFLSLFGCFVSSPMITDTGTAGEPAITAQKPPLEASLLGLSSFFWHFNSAKKINAQE